MGSGGGLGNPVVADGLKAPFKGVHTDELRLPLFRTGVTGEAVMGGPQDGMVGAVGEILKESRLLRALDLAYGADRGGNVRERPFAQGFAQGHAGAVHVQPYGGQPQRAEERRQFRSGVRGIKASRIGADIRNDAPFPASGPEGRAQDKGEPAFGEQDECEARMLVREREVHLRRVTHVVPAGQKGTHRSPSAPVPTGSFQVRSYSSSSPWLCRQWLAVSRHQKPEAGHSRPAGRSCSGAFPCCGEGGDGGSIFHGRVLP